LSRKAVHNWVEKFSQGRSKIADDAGPDADVAETIVEETSFYEAGFDALVKQRETSVSMLVEDMSRNKCFLFLRLEYHMFYVLYPFVAYLLTVPQYFEIPYKLGRRARVWQGQEGPMKILRSHSYRMKMFPPIHIALGKATLSASHISCCLVRPRVWGSNYACASCLCPTNCVITTTASAPPLTPRLLRH
jgi:hypothetical protein